MNNVEYIGLNNVQHGVGFIQQTRQASTCMLKCGGSFFYLEGF